MSASKGVLFLMTAGGEFTPDLSALSLPHLKTPMWISSDVLDIITLQELVRNFVVRNISSSWDVNKEGSHRSLMSTVFPYLFCSMSYCLDSPGIKKIAWQNDLLLCKGFLLLFQSSEVPGWLHHHPHLPAISPQCQRTAVSSEVETWPIRHTHSSVQRGGQRGESKSLPKGQNSINRKRHLLFKLVRGY